MKPNNDDFLPKGYKKERIIHAPYVLSEEEANRNILEVEESYNTPEQKRLAERVIKKQKHARHILTN